MMQTRFLKTKSLLAMVVITIGVCASPLANAQMDWSACETQAPVPAPASFLEWLSSWFKSAPLAPSCAPNQQLPNTSSPVSIFDNNWTGWSTEGAVQVQKSQNFINRLKKNPVFDTAIHQDQSWTSLLDADTFLLPLAQKSADYIHTIRDQATLEFLFSEPSGVSEGYSIGEHTSRVLALLQDQAQPYQISQIPVQASIRDVSRLLQYTLAFHDIGKSIAFRGGDKSRETHYSDPLAIDLLTAAGFNADEVRLGVGLISAHQLIGTYLQGYMSLEDAQTGIREGALYAKIDEAAFFQLLEVVFVCDAGSYPGLYHRVFDRQANGRLTPKAAEYQDLRKNYVTIAN